MLLSKLLSRVISILQKKGFSPYLEEKELAASYRWGNGASLYAVQSGITFTTAATSQKGAKRMKFAACFMECHFETALQSC